MIRGASVAGLTISLGFGLWPNPASADSIAELLVKPPKATSVSVKSALSLQYCIGLGVSDYAPIATLQGERQTLIFGTIAGTASTAFVISIEDKVENRSVEIRASKSWDDKLINSVAGCV